MLFKIFWKYNIKIIFNNFNFFFCNLFLTIVKF